MKVMDIYSFQVTEEPEAYFKPLPSFTVHWRRSETTENEVTQRFTSFRIQWYSHL